jgi:predicted ATPase
MLRRVEIKDFRSCHDVVLDDLGPMTVLVGRNAVGKTNILQAIHWAAQSATSREISLAGEDQKVSLEFKTNEATYSYSLQSPDFSLGTLYGGTTSIKESLFDNSNHNKTKEYFDRIGSKVKLCFAEPSQISIGSLVSSISAIYSLLPSDSNIIQSIHPFRSCVERVRYYPLIESDSGSIVFQKKYDEWLSKYNSTGDPGSSVLYRLLKLRLSGDPRFQEILDLLGPNGLNLIDDYELSRPPEDSKDNKDAVYQFRFQPSSQSEYFPPSSLSTGTQRIIRLVVSLVFDQSSVMLIEQPEDSIHRGLIRKIIAIMRAYSQQTQVIIASHASVIFDLLEPKDIRLVTMQEGKTRVRALTAEEIDAAKLFMEEQGTLSEFLETVEED